MHTTDTADLDRNLLDCIARIATVGPDADAFLALIDDGLASARQLLARESGRRHELHAVMLTLYSRGEMLLQQTPPDLLRIEAHYRLLLEGVTLAAQWEDRHVHDEILCKIIRALLGDVVSFNESLHASYGGTALLDTLRTLTDRPMLFFESITELAAVFDKKYQVALWQAQLVLMKRHIGSGRSLTMHGKDIAFYLESLFRLIETSSHEWERYSSSYSVSYDQIREHLRSLLEDELGWLLQHAQALLEPSYSGDFFFLFLIVDRILSRHAGGKPWGLALCVQLKTLLLKVLGWYGEREQISSMATALRSVYKVAVMLDEAGAGEEALVWLNVGMDAALRVAKVGNYLAGIMRIQDVGIFPAHICLNFLLAMALQKIALLDDQCDARAELASVLFAASEHWWIDFEKGRFETQNGDVYRSNQLMWLSVMARLSAPRAGAAPRFRDKVHFMIDEINRNGMPDAFRCMSINYLPGYADSGALEIFLDSLSRLAAAEQREEQEPDNLFLACLVAGVKPPHALIDEWRNARSFVLKYQDGGPANEARAAARTESYSRLRQCLQPWKTTA